MKTLVLLAVAFIGSGAVGTFVGKVMPQRTSKADRLEKMDDDLGELRGEFDLFRTDSIRTMNTQADYIGELRQHIVDGKPPPPPPYPPGMKV